MKTLKNLLILALAVVMVLSFAACGGNANGGATMTPRPTPRPTTVDISAEQLNNYYVAYTVTKAGELVLDENGQYVEKKDATNMVEVGYSSVVLESKDGGTSYAVGSTQCFNSSSDITTQPKSIFSVHMNYEKTELEDKGKETVAGRECTHYYYKNGLMEVHMYVDDTFGTTGICLKYEAVGYMPQTIEVTELKFDVVNVEEGYEFVNFQSKVATPAPADEVPAA